MKKAYHHGEILFLESEKPKDLPVKSESNVIIKGHTGNSHSFKNGIFYSIKKDEYIIGYFEAKETILLHIEHGEVKNEDKLMEAKLPDGFYEVRIASEYINGELKQIID